MREKKQKQKKTDDWLDNIKYPNSSKIIIFHDLLLISIFSFIVIFVPTEVRVELELQRDKSEFALSFSPSPRASYPADNASPPPWPDSLLSFSTVWSLILLSSPLLLASTYLHQSYFRFPTSPYTPRLPYTLFHF